MLSHSGELRSSIVCSLKDIELKLRRVGTIVAVKIFEGRTYAGRESYTNGSRDTATGRRLFSSTCIEEMRTPGRRQERLAHDNSLAKGGLKFRYLYGYPAPYILSS